MHARIRVVSCVVMNQFNKKEGYVKVLGFRLFYRAFVPSAPKGTLLCLHGGPGACHDYMLPLANLANSGYMVLFYDQLGCGRSEVPRNLALFTVERGVEELEALRRKMKLGRVHLLGSSYGGLLALTYALKYQKNLKSLITTGGLANVPLAIDEMNRLKSKLPRRVQKTMERYEQRGKYEHHEYEKATMIFLQETSAQAQALATRAGLHDGSFEQACVLYYEWTERVYYHWESQIFRHHTQAPQNQSSHSCHWRQV